MPVLLVRLMLAWRLAVGGVVLVTLWVGGAWLRRHLRVPTRWRWRLLLGIPLIILGNLARLRSDKVIWVGLPFPIGVFELRGGMWVPFSGPISMLPFITNVLAALLVADIVLSLVALLRRSR